ncbi:MAG TPA: hypothetical protein VGY97_01200 [Solirubrobacteraceae bacterium]|nr:hypothetical protein [Solirubrobacteraceae bacterium]
MARRRGPLSSLAVAAGALLALSGCGHSHPLHADTEGIYLELGSLRYQVEISRQLNPQDTEDSAYLSGLTPAQARLLPNQAWYGVWILVENRSGATQTPTTDFTVFDTQHNVYTPTFPNATNVLAYHSVPIPGHGQIPDLGSPAYNSPTQGVLLLFKINLASYENRPLDFAITVPSLGQTATTDLDV